MAEDAAVTVDASAGGIKGRLTLRDSLSAENVIHLIILILLGVLLYLVSWQEGERERRYNGTEKIMAQILVEVQRSAREHEKVIANQSNIINESKVQTYVLTLEPEERRKLKLAMPDELRNRVNGR